MRALLFVLCFVGCASGDKVLIIPVTDPGQVFIEELELRLLKAKTMHIVVESTSTGAVTSALAMDLFLGEGQRARFEVKGTFEGKPVNTWFMCDGTSMKVRGKPTTPAAPEVRDAFVIGLVRMGLLHNAAIVIGGAPPDHVNGNAHAWVKAERARAGIPATEITYDVVINHDVMGEAVLTLNDRAEPVRRTAKVSFEEGEMTVDEKVTLFELDVPVDESVFAL